MRAEIDLEALYNNICVMRKSTSAQLFAVVKANAYGHGVAIATYLQPYVDGFCVATYEEALRLLGIGVYKTILILGVTKEVCSNKQYENIVYSVGSLSDIKYIESVNKGAKFFIKINTGMNRLGCDKEEIGEIAYYVRHKSLNCVGFYTHFFNVDGDLSEKQYSLFESAISASGTLGLESHCCASNMLNLESVYHKDIVRVGLALYGYGFNDKGLQPAMKVSAPILKLRQVNKNDYIGYGNYRAASDCCIAVIRAGYGDGYRRIRNGTKRYVSVKGILCPIVGQVCMDMCMVDVSNIDVMEGERVYLLGNGVSCETLAEEYGTIVYEVLTSFNERVERVYLNGKNTIKNTDERKTKSRI